MTYTFTDGTQATTASEANLFDLTNDAEFAAWIFLHNMTASETFTIKVYVRDQSAVSMRLYNSVDFTGVQSSPAVYIAPLLTKEFKVTIQRTAGSDKSVNWQVIEVT
jgi:hypothetical protein